MADRRTPFPVAGERETLRQFLDYLRESIVLKARGVEDHTVRRALVPSGTSLLGLVKHLTRVEAAWFQWCFAGRDVWVPDGELAPDDTTDGVIAAYEAAITTSNEIVDGCHDLDRRCARKGTAPEPMTMRWILVHMVEETGRHAGHADILREQLDGSTGR